MTFCFECEEIFVEGKTPEVKIRCQICTKQFHLKCVENLNAVQHKCISSSTNIWWSCNTCSKFCDFFDYMTTKVENLVAEVAQNTAKLKEQEQTLSEIKEATKLRINVNKTPSAAGVPKRTFANILSGDDQLFSDQQANKNRKLAEARVIKDNNDPILVIQAKNESEKEKLSSVVKSTLKHGVDPVQSINTTGQGKVVICCKDHDSVTMIKNKIESGIGDKVTVSEPKSVMPRIRVVGVDEEYVTADVPDTADENEDLMDDDTQVTVTYNTLLNRIRSDNLDCFDFNSTLSIVSVKKRFNQKRYDVTLSTDTNSFKKIMAKQKLRIDWELYPVHEQLNVIRCYKCNNYGHVAGECKQSNFSCPKCAGDHNVQDCNSKISKCINCMRANEQLNKNLPTNHTVWNTDCPVYVHKLELKRKRVRYSK